LAEDFIEVDKSKIRSLMLADLAQKVNAKKIDLTQS
jgi:hypothetical protein